MASRTRGERDRTLMRRVKQKIEESKLTIPFWMRVPESVNTPVFRRAYKRYGKNVCKIPAELREYPIYGKSTLDLFYCPNNPLMPPIDESTILENGETFNIPCCISKTSKFLLLDKLNKLPEDTMLYLYKGESIPIEIMVQDLKDNEDILQDIDSIIVVGTDGTPWAQFVLIGDNWEISKPTRIPRDNIFYRALDGIYSAIWDMAEDIKTIDIPRIAARLPTDVLKDTTSKNLLHNAAIRFRREDAFDKILEILRNRTPEEGAVTPPLHD